MIYSERFNKLISGTTDDSLFMETVNYVINSIGDNIHEVRMSTDKNGEHSFSFSIRGKTFSGNKQFRTSILSVQENIRLSISRRIVFSDGEEEWISVISNSVCKDNLNFEDFKCSVLRNFTASLCIFNSLIGSFEEE